MSQSKDTIPPPPPVILEPRRDGDLRRLARLLAELAWKRAQALHAAEGAQESSKRAA